MVIVFLEGAPTAFPVILGPIWNIKAFSPNLSHPCPCCLLLQTGYYPGNLLRKLVELNLLDAPPTRGLAVTFRKIFSQLWRKWRGGEGWYHRVEEEGGGERGGPTVWRKREGRLFSIGEITTCLIRGSMG